MIRRPNPSTRTYFATARSNAPSVTLTFTTVDESPLEIQFRDDLALMFK